MKIYKASYGPSPQTWRIFEQEDGQTRRYVGSFYCASSVQTGKQDLRLMLAAPCLSEALKSVSYCLVMKENDPCDMAALDHAESTLKTIADRAEQ